MDKTPQWVVRVLDRVVRLPASIRGVGVQPCESLKVRYSWYMSCEPAVEPGKLKNNTIRQHAFWVYLDWFEDRSHNNVTACFSQLLCGVYNRETADRIVDALSVSLFDNCGDNTFVDFRELLAADAATDPDADITAQPVAGRFVDLHDEDEIRKPAAVARTGIADARISSARYPPGPVGPVGSPGPPGIVGGMDGYASPMWTLNTGAPITGAAPWPVTAQVASIGRGVGSGAELPSEDEMAARIASQSEAAAARQRPTNRTTVTATDMRANRNRLDVGSEAPSGGFSVPLPDGRPSPVYDF